MGLWWCSWFLVASVWCINNINGYRLETDDNKALDVEIDFFSPKLVDQFNDPDSGEVTTRAQSNRSGEDRSGKRMYLLFLHNNDNYTGGNNNDSTALDSWSVVWYVASFGGLIVFFLIVSCSEWCCRRAIRNSQNCNRSAGTAATPTVPDTPPPSYDQFAPPSYESICLGRSSRGGEKSEYDIYVVPVHTLGTLMESRHEDVPPSYLSASRVVT